MSEWIKVKDQLPDDCSEGECAVRHYGKKENPLITVPFRFVDDVWYPHFRDDDDDEFIECAMNGTLYLPEYWKPFTEPPK